MKKREILTLNYVIKESLKIAKGAKFCYGLMKNEDNVKPEIDRLKKIEDGYAEGIKEFSEARNALITKLGKPTKEGMVQVTDENIPEFRKEEEKLQKKHKAALDVYDAAMAEYDKTILDEEMDEPLKVYEISVSNVPDGFQETRTDLFQTLVRYKIITD